MVFSAQAPDGVLDISPGKLEERLQYNASIEVRADELERTLNRILPHIGVAVACPIAEHGVDFLIALFPSERSLGAGAGVVENLVIDTEGDVGEIRGGML